jgi:hypothetical protein
MRTVIRASGIVLGVLVCSHAQWLNYPTPGTPRSRDGKPRLSAPTPRASNAKPDLSGVWQIEPPPAGEIERLVGPGVGGVVVETDDPREFSKYFFNILTDFKPEDALMRPWAAERLRQRRFPDNIIREEFPSHRRCLSWACCVIGGTFTPVSPCSTRPGRSNTEPRNAASCGVISRNWVNTSIFSCRAATTSAISRKRAHLPLSASRHAPSPNHCDGWLQICLKRIRYERTSPLRRIPAESPSCPASSFTACSYNAACERASRQF